MVIGAIIATLVITYLVALIDPFWGGVAAVCVMGGIILKRVEELEEKLAGIQNPEPAEETEEADTTEDA